MCKVPTRGRCAKSHHIEERCVQTEYIASLYTITNPPGDARNNVTMESVGKAYMTGDLLSITYGMNTPGFLILITHLLVMSPFHCIVIYATQSPCTSRTRHIIQIAGKTYIQQRVAVARYRIYTYVYVSCINQSCAIQKSQV